MSVSIFNAVPAGAIEVLSDTTGAPCFKRADLGRFLGLVDVKATYRDTSTVSRKLLSKGVISTHQSQRQNDHDAFVDLEGALEIVVRSRKPKAVKLVKLMNSQRCGKGRARAPESDGRETTRDRRKRHADSSAR